MYDVWAVWLLYDVWDVWAVWAVWPYIGLVPCVNAVWAPIQRKSCMRRCMVRPWVRPEAGVKKTVNTVFRPPWEVLGGVGVCQGVC